MKMWEHENFIWSMIKRWEHKERNDVMLPFVLECSQKTTQNLPKHGSMINIFGAS
jgi:hypothetical protein